MTNTMKGLFFIIKGSYKRGVEPTFLNPATETPHSIGCYNPEDPNTEEWYMLVDCETFTCACASMKLERVLEGLKNTIEKYKGSRESYLRIIREIRRVPPSVEVLYRTVYEHYGDYFSDLVADIEEQALENVRKNKPVRRILPKLDRHKIKGEGCDTHTQVQGIGLYNNKEETEEKGLRKSSESMVVSPARKIKPRKNFSQKRLSLS